MRYSEAYIPTRKEDPAEAEVVSHRLMIRAGYVRQLAAGIYSFLPLGWRVVRKIERIVREEMDRAGALEVRLPSVQPAELWRESGRWDQYGPELLRFRDRRNNDYCLGPTHEEVIVDLVRDEVRSYRQLPLNLYQIQTKFRDEIRPRAGLMRGREFIMKDAYSFDIDDEGANRSYDLMFEAYNRMFRRCGLRFRPVEADTGNIGGSRSHEFQVLADSGEDAIASCPNCDYTANVERAAIGPETPRDPSVVRQPLMRVDTPNAKSVDEVTAFLGIPAESLVKTLIYDADDGAVAVLVRGDTEANAVKIREVLGADRVALADEARVAALTRAPVGFAGPVGLDIPIIADHLVAAMADFVIGANQSDAHFTGANWDRDFAVKAFVDVRVASAGDRCGRCGHAFEDYRGIEVGHVFFLGTKYSESMKATALDAEGKPKPFIMGCYGVGITRIASATIEQNHDEYGIVWPMALAPYHVTILALQPKNEALMAVASRLHDQLEAAGIDVLLDDRDERPGFKFKDADLIGVPLRVTLGDRGLKEGVAELKHRSEADHVKVPLDALAATIVSRVRAELAESAA